ncbi:MAG TPA: cytochrome ubiquinol oxidase subunit I, partial [Anaerolineae bacterium]|nr:cytochrome ubiquinol oxidase subunit I [Anaerolineae bacterium]
LPRLLLHGLAWMSVSGWLATLAGWYVTEIGRQPFLVYGLLRTADLASSTPSSHIGLTLTAYLLMYAGLLYAYVRVMRHLARTPVEKLLGVHA